MRDVDAGSIGEDVPLLEGMRTPRAIRRLLPDPVPPELIRKVCEAGTFAPSGGNRQPWKFIAVTEPERRAWVAERYRASFLEYICPGREAAKRTLPSQADGSAETRRPELLPWISHLCGVACHHVPWGGGRPATHAQYGTAIRLGKAAGGVVPNVS